MRTSSLNVIQLTEKQYHMYEYCVCGIPVLEGEGLRSCNTDPPIPALNMQKKRRLLSKTGKT
jgi:hypothetical protein